MNGDRNILKELIAERIKENGPISFREFMEMALYYPKFGYYEKEVSIGKTGDFVTSPKVGSIFGRTLFKAFREMLEIVESNTLLELGAGDGTLAEDIILKAKEINIELDYIIIEKSEKLRRMIRNKLGKYRVKILKSLEEIGDKISGIIFSNELIDALPVHIVEREKDGLYEIFIDCKDGEFEELKVKLKDKRIISYINEMGIELRDGQRIEVNLDAEKILASIYEILEKGFVVFIDYGYIAEEITAPYRLKGTLRGFKGHRIVDDVLKEPGSIDITSSVNFTALAKLAKEIGYELIGFTNQANFLVDAGILEEIRNEDDIKAVKYLILPNGGMGEVFKVLILAKGIGKVHLSSLKNAPKRPSFNIL